MKYIAKQALIDALLELNDSQAPATTLVQLGVALSTASRSTNNYLVQASTAYRIADLLERPMRDLFEPYKPSKHGSRRTLAGRVVPNSKVGGGRVKRGPKVTLRADPEPQIIDLAGPDATMSIADGVLTLRLKLADYSGEDIAYLMTRFGSK
mgnify:CR=1 FL=1